MSRSDVRINGGFFVLKREILDMIEPGDELVEETFERLIAARELVAYPVRGVLRPDGHDQGPPAARDLNESGKAPWRRSARTVHGVSAARLTHVLSLSAAEPLRRVLAIGCHADDIEIGCGGTLLALARSNPEVDGGLGRPRCAAASARRRRARALQHSSAAVAEPRVDVHDFRDGFLPYVGGEVKDVFEELKAASTRRSSSRTPATTSTRITDSPAS